MKVYANFTWRPTAQVLEASVSGPDIFTDKNPGDAPSCVRSALRNTRVCMKKNLSNLSVGPKERRTVEDLNLRLFLQPRVSHDLWFYI